MDEQDHVTLGHDTSMSQNVKTRQSLPACSYKDKLKSNFRPEVTEKRPAIPLFDISKLYSAMGLLKGSQQKLRDELPVEPRLVYRSTLQHFPIHLPSRNKLQLPEKPLNSPWAFPLGQHPFLFHAPSTESFGSTVSRTGSARQSIATSLNRENAFEKQKKTGAPPLSVQKPYVIKEPATQPPAWLQLDKGEMLVLDPVAHTPFRLTPIRGYGLQSLMHWVSVMFLYCTSRQLVDPLTKQQYAWISKHQAVSLEGYSFYAVEALSRETPRSKKTYPTTPRVIQSLS